MDSPDEVTGPINLGNPGEFTMLELAETIVRLTGSQSKLIFEPLPSDDPKRRQPDITQAAEILDWKPNMPLEEGLRHTVEYFRQYA
jgi:UDP-glucuronate decarboxylase